MNFFNSSFISSFNNVESCLPSHLKEHMGLDVRCTVDSDKVLIQNH